MKVIANQHDNSMTCQRYSYSDHVTLGQYIQTSRDQGLGQTSRDKYATSESKIRSVTAEAATSSASHATSESKIRSVTAEAATSSASHATSDLKKLRQYTSSILQLGWYTSSILRWKKLRKFRKGEMEPLQRGTLEALTTCHSQPMVDFLVGFC